MKTQTINITRRDIEFGERKNSYRCPAAIALKRLFPGKVIFVGCAYSTVGANMARHPEKLLNFISRFDKGETVQPIKVRLTFKPCTTTI